MNSKNRMLTVPLIAILCALTASVAEGQESSSPRMGIKGGLNVSNLHMDDVTDKNPRFGINLGIYGQVFSNDVFAVQPELLFSMKGTHNEYDGIADGKLKFNLNYLDLPVLAVFKLGESAEIHAGAYASYLLHANVSYEGDLGSGSEDLDRDHFKSFDYGLVGGFGLNFGAVQVGARYNYGLVEIADSDAANLILGDAKNSVAQIYMAINLNHSGRN